MGVTQGAGLSLRWFRDNFGYTESWYARQADVDPYELIIREAERVRPGSDGLLWLPYLMGERTPHLDSQARGMWFGLTAAHTRSHLVRSILEGVAFSLRDSLEIFKELGIPVEQIRASGGGSRSFLWRQIQADIYGKELVTLRTSEGSALGAALLAGVGAKIYASVEESAQEAIQVKESMAPKPDNVAAYERYYQVYRGLYPAVQELLAHSGKVGSLARPEPGQRNWSRRGTSGKAPDHSAPAHAAENLLPEVRDHETTLAICSLRSVFFAIIVGVAAAPVAAQPGLTGLARSIISYFSVRSVMAAPTPEFSAKLEQTQYRKWNVYKLSNGLVSLYIAPEHRRAGDPASARRSRVSFS